MGGKNFLTVQRRSKIGIWCLNDSDFRHWNCYGFDDMIRLLKTSVFLTYCSIALNRKHLIGDMLTISKGQSIVMVGNVVAGRQAGRHTGRAMEQ